MILVILLKCTKMNMLYNLQKQYAFPCVYNVFFLVTGGLTEVVIPDALTKVSSHES